MMDGQLLGGNGPRAGLRRVWQWGGDSGKSTGRAGTGTWSPRRSPDGSAKSRTKVGCGLILGWIWDEGLNGEDWLRDLEEGQVEGDLCCEPLDRPVKGLQPGGAEVEALRTGRAGAVAFGTRARVSLIRLMYPASLTQVRG